MLTVKAKIPVQAGYEPILPLAVPDLKEVKSFANHLHSLGAHWQGEIFGWQVLSGRGFSPRAYAGGRSGHEYWYSGCL